MKIRCGFVTNSSSSSYLIAYHGNELTRDMLEVAFDVNEDSLLYPLASEMIDFFLENGTKYTLRQALDNWGADDLQDLPKHLRRAYLEGYKVIEGYASDDGGTAESIICNMKIDYGSDDLIIYKEEGY